MSAQDAKIYTYKQNIVVNPNYLKIHKIIDENGERIKIQENNRNIILLVPQKYKNKEYDIKKYYIEDHKDCAVSDEENYGIKVDKHNNCKVDIIWIKNDQKIFTYDIEVNTGDNCVSDAIIKVITEKNSFISERNCINGNGSIDSLKIKLKGQVEVVKAHYLICLECWTSRTVAKFYFLGNNCLK